MLRSYIWAVSISALVVSLPARSGDRAEIDLRWEDLPSLLKGKNLAIKGAERVADAAAERTGHLARSFLPNLDAHVGVENFKSAEVDRATQGYGAIEARINLFRGGRDSAEDQVREAQHALAVSDSDERRRTQLSDLRKAFWTFVFQREMATHYRDALVQSERGVAAANRRISRGLTTDTDRLDFEINRDELREEVESIEHEAQITQIRIRALLGADEAVRYKALDAIPHQHDDALVSSDPAQYSFPEVQSSMARASSFMAQGAQALRWWLPSLDAYAGAFQHTFREKEYLDASLRRENVIGARLTLNLFDGLQSARAGSAWRIQADGQEDIARQARRDQQALVRAAQEEMKHAHELTHLAEARLKQGSLYLRKTLAEYDRGVKNSPDLLGAIQRQLGLQRRYAEIRRDYQFSKTDLLRLTGN
jgi:outer membrane protein TolC